MMALASKRLTRWSPLTCLPRATLTPSGLLELDVSDREVELMRRVDTELRADDRMVPLLPDGNVASTAGLDWVDRETELKVILTTHRIVLRPQNEEATSSAASNNSSSNNNVCFLHLSNVTSAFVSHGNGMIQAFSAPRLTLQSYMGNLVLVFRGSLGDAKKDRDDFLERLQKALERKGWETAQRLQAKHKTSQQVSRRKVGVDAIMTKHTLRHKEAARLTHDAFQGDAETLLREAAELVTVIHKYVSTLEKQQQSDDGNNSDAARLSDMLQNMGMTSALAKDQFRGLQHDEYITTLARQVADFLRPLLPTSGGVMTMTEVYCLYNRARGTNLISPEDLLDAVGCMKRLNLGMSERTFPTSGVKVVQDDRFDAQVMETQLQELANSGGRNVGVTAMDVGRELHISALLAHEQLLASEHMGYLCRDETLETTRFFPNRFAEFSWNQ